MSSIQRIDQPAHHWEADTAVTGLKELYIGYLGTGRSHRGHELARAVLATVLTEAAQAGYQHAGLRVDASLMFGAMSHQRPP